MGSARSTSTVKRRVQFSPVVQGTVLFMSLLVWLGIPLRQALSAEAGAQTDPALVAQINSRRGLLKTIVDRDTGATEGRRKLKAALSASLPVDTPAKELGPMIVTLAEVGALTSDGRQNTGYIQHKEIVATLAAGLNSPIDEVRTVAHDLLLTKAKPEHLKACAAEIRRSLQANFAPPAAVRLQALLDPDRASVEQLLADASLPLDIRARLGDAAAEGKLIEQFEQADEPQAKGNLAKELGYVGSPRAIRALAAAFKSPLVLRLQYEHISVRYRILEALSRSYPDEPLLTTELQRIKERGDDAYGKNNLEAYFARVAQWGRQTLSVDLSAEPPLILYQRPIVKRPLTRKE